MKVHKHISSPQNPLIKKIILLKNKQKLRTKTALFVIEGQREIQLALDADFHLEFILLCEEFIPLNEVCSWLKKGQKPFLTTVSKAVYQKIAHRGTTEGVVGIAKQKKVSLSDFKFIRKNPLILIAEAPEKPGNIGALLRTATAANLDIFIIANPKTDLYHPNIIRSSVGSIFIGKTVMASTTEIIAFLNQHSINFYGACLQATTNYYAIDYTLPTAIVVGAEDKGLSDLWIKNTTQNVVIPMQGGVDSINVSVAAGILIFEAKKQRQFQF